MSVWSRDDDKADRMDSIVQAYKAEQIDRARQLETYFGTVATLLRDVADSGSGLSPDECVELAKLIEAQL